MKLRHVLLILLLPAICTTVIHAEDEDWYLVEFSANRPACSPADEAQGKRCWETDSRTSLFEVRDGEVLSMASSTELPPAWVALQQLWLYVPAAESEGFTLSLDRTPGGVRLQLREGSVSYLQTLPLDTWVRLDRVNARQLWARVRVSADG